MKSFPTLVIEDFLLPHRDVGAVVSNVGVLWGERCAVEDVGGLLSLDVGFEGCSGAFEGHDSGGGGFPC